MVDKWELFNVHTCCALDGNLIPCYPLLNWSSCPRPTYLAHQCTLVGLSTRPAPLIISKSLQFRTFWSQSKTLFMLRCMLSVGSGSKTFGALKVTIYVNFFKLSVHKMNTFLCISVCQWTMPIGLFAKKSHPKFFCSC